jgi:tripartite-type tricarboxylate transporter receptor subunit TctC
MNPVSTNRRQALLSTALGVVAGLMAIGGPASVQAQDWPAKPVRIMVGASAGGGTDVIARLFAEKFAEATRQSFVVENRPGASNTIAADLTAKAPADGHTLLVATNTGQAIAPHLLKLGYDPLKSLQPIGLIVVVPNVLLVNPGVGVTDVKGLISKMKADPGGFRYASSGVGSTQHLAGEAFDLAAGTRSVHVPYKGSSQAHIDLIGGQVQIMFDTTSSSMPHIRSGKLKALAVMSARRSPELPDVPTLAEAGLSGVEMTTWYGLFTTGDTPAPVVAKLRAAFEAAMKLPDVGDKLRSLGGTPGEMDIDAFASFNRAEFERFGKLIRDAGVQVGK